MLKHISDHFPVKNMWGIQWMWTVIFVSNSTCLKYGQTRSHKFVDFMCMLKVMLKSHPCDVSSSTNNYHACDASTTSTHRPTTTHVHFATTSPQCNVTRSPPTDTISAAQEWQQPSNKWPWPPNNKMREAHSNPKRQPLPMKTTHDHHRPWLDARTQLTRHHQRRRLRIVRWPALSTSANTKCKASDAKQLNNARRIRKNDGQ